MRVGEFDADEDPDCSAGFCARPPQDIAVDHVVVHPSYERASFRHDVALLVLKAPMAFSVSVQPVCISQNVAGVVGQRAKLVGWGITAGQSGECGLRPVSWPCAPHCPLPLTRGHSCRCRCPWPAAAAGPTRRAA